MGEITWLIFRILGTLTVAAAIIIGVFHLSARFNEQVERIDNLPKPTPTPYVIEIDGEPVQCVTFRGALSCEWPER